jgi:glycosidase
MQGRKPDENIRLPMQWSDAENAGFTTGKPWRAPDSAYAQINIAAQADDPASLLSHYRALIQLRNAHPALRTGSLIILPTGKNSVYAVVRAEGEDRILVLINLDAKPYNDYTLDWATSGLNEGATLTPLMGIGDPSTLSARPVDELAPFSTYIFQIE